jgi:hypothetical protein
MWSFGCSEPTKYYSGSQVKEDETGRGKRVLVGKLNRPLEGLEVNWRIILKRNLRK